MLRLFTLLLALTASTAQTFAATPAEKLKALFDSATAPATIGDIARDGEASTQKCVILRASGLSEITLKVVARDASQNNGPLFPPGEEVTVVIFGSIEGSLASRFDRFQLHSTPKEMIVDVAPRTFFDLPEPMQYRLRKKGNLVSFKRSVLATTPYEQYGYCYPEGESQL